MSRFPQFALILLLGLFLSPTISSAATFQSARTLVVSEAPADNAYLWGTDVNVVAALPADIAAFGGSVTVSGPVAGDVLLGGAQVLLERSVLGDVRVFGAEISIDASLGGDLLAAGGSVIASSTAKDTRIIGRTVEVRHAGGDVTLYGADISLAGDIQGDVRIIASDRVTLAPDTHITGTLRYDAPQQAVIPPTAVVDGGVTYTGSSAFLPTDEEAHRLAVAGIGVFFAVRIIALLIGTGLLAGLFPVLGNQVVARVLDQPVRRTVPLALLGFGFLVAAPVLILLLVISFVGIAAALILAAFYGLILLVAYFFTGIIAGAALARTIWKRKLVTWKDGVVGMLILTLIEAIPFVGPLLMFLLMITGLGTLLSLSYRFAFGRTVSSDLSEEV